MTKKIMVVDNSQSVLKLMREILSSDGHEIRTAASGLEALELLEDFLPDVMFIDLVMPKISGDKLCRILRSMPEFNEVYLVILSAIAVEQDVDVTSFGANACVAKGPFAEMHIHIRAVLEQADGDWKQGSGGEIIGTEKVYKREVTQELLSVKKHFELTLENMAEGFAELTADGKVIYVNPAICSLLGLAEEKILSCTFKHFFEQQQADLIDRVLADTVSGPQTLGEESVFVIGDRQVVLHFLPVEDETYMTILVIVQDITERKKAEQAAIERKLHQAQKMEALGLMAGGVAHDLNNILSGLVGYPDLLLQQLPEDSSMRDVLVAIKESGRRAAAVVSDLLTIARGVSSVRETVSLNTLVDEYLQSPEGAAVIARYPGIAVRTDLNQDDGHISCSPVHVKKCIMNLLTNAAEAVETDGFITIVTGRKCLNASEAGKLDVKEGEYMTISVSDSGPGISPADLKRIFEPFYTKKSMGTSGTGLGLTVVWNAVRDNRGAVSVQSGTEGTTFTLYFPVVEKAVKDASPVRSVGELSGTGTVLIVDDEEQQCRIMAKMLEMLGYTVMTATSGGEALAHLQKYSVDLVLLDMIMPDMNGKELFERIVELHPSQKALFVSGYSQEEEVEKAMLLGVSGFVRKPFTLEELGLAVQAEMQTFGKF